MRFDMKRVGCVILLLCVLFLCGCRPSMDFLKEKEQGLYPTASDFPNTKWACRELDMCLYMFEREENCMIGTYNYENVSYRVVAYFDFDRLNFEIYSSTEISDAEYSDSMVHCNRISFGFIYTKYLFDKDTNTIVCTINNKELYDKRFISHTLTFEKIGSITRNVGARWYAQEIDMYLDSFGDVDCYFRGEIVIEGEKCYVHAMEIGNNGYFLLSIENGKINNLISGTTSPLIYMYFGMKNNQIIAKVSDEFYSDAELFPYWPYDDSIISFKLLAS